MHLDSARELKRTALKTLMTCASSPKARSAVVVSARGLDATQQRPGSMAVGVARSGKRGFKLALRLQHRSMEGSKEVESLVKKAKGEVDVRYVGRIVKSAVPWRQKRQRPLRIGSSVGHVQITAGTLGCFVRDRKDDWLYVLSNNHVLANENQASIGDEIIQPGQYDGGRADHDRIGGLERFVKLKTRGVNFVDSAVAWIDENIEINPCKLTGLGRLSGLGSEFVDPGAEVSKIGRTTGLTQGVVTAFELDNIVVEFDAGSLRFDDQIEIEGAGSDAFSDGGDSGSLIVDGDRNAVALLFAGGDQGGSNGKGLTYANPIRAVLNALKVDLYTG